MHIAINAFWSLQWHFSKAGDQPKEAETDWCGLTGLLD